MSLKRTIISSYPHRSDGEWGTSISIDYNKEDGSVERLYDIPEWDVLYRDIPPIICFGSDTEYGELQVKVVTPFTTTCINNNTDETLHFPHEMCVATALVYPAMGYDL